MGRLLNWLELYFHEEGMHHYAINFVLYLTTIREKYVKMYTKFIEEIKSIHKQ